MKTLILLRGIPGSGKSTIAHALMAMHNDAEHYEADQYFMKDGEYKFKKEELGHAHDWCHMQVSNAIKFGVKTVIVSNTFLQLWEFEEYLLEAMAYGYDIQVLDCQSTFKDIHGVPQETLEKMYKRKQFFDLESFRWRNNHAQAD